MALLEVHDITSGYGELQILWGIDFAMEQGQLTTLVGSNGAGKTTLLRTIVGQLKPWQGKVFFQGQDVSRLPPYTKAEMGLIMAPEGRQLFTDMSVLENLEMGATPRRARPRQAQNIERVFALFPRLKERMHQRAGTMSGGEQQMLAVARGIMSEPVILIVDEMSLGLAPVLALDLFQALRRLRKEGYTILLVEQNVRMALKVSDYAYVLAKGKVDRSGPSRQVENDQEVRRAYLGI
ncbi:MAG: ABC transporter ATP-binding protein [Caldilineaceae bacterium]|jgi:branched-chain amino acid transport system ATP-binding protein|nr:ABC transporter ATP-binding protein [Caldilineaceae bacterium]